MQLVYDFHIHTAASPCADEQMSPNNIVNMTKLSGIDVIAITDHNTCANCLAVMTVGEQLGVLVIPGMEIECMEEFHSVALFPTLEAAAYVEAVITKHLPPIKNRPKIFGDQLVLDAQDEIVGTIDQLLITAVQLPASEIYEIVRKVGGVIYPAHIDRNAYSVLSNLGSIPEELNTQHVELSIKGRREDYMDLVPQNQIIRSSDAHYLEQLCCEHEFLEVDTYSLEGIFTCLKK
ncbi:MAG: PHP domain-containing protein [Cellulosilyticaceae bacterium]